MTVGRDERETVRLDDELRAIEKVAGVLACDRKLRFRDHFLQRLTRKRGASRSGCFRQTGEILPRERLHPRIESVRRDFDAVLVFDDPDISLRKGLDDLVEFLCWERQRSTLTNRSRASTSQRHFEVGRQESYLFPFCLDEHVRKNWNGVLSLDNALE